MIAIYARQSIEKKDSVSIETQISYAKREIFSEDFKIYQDAGYSGKNTNRPAFSEMMNDIASGSVEKVVVYRLDRISRSIVDFADFINVLEEKHVSFVSATEKFDTSTPMGRAMLYIVVVFAQLERETIAERVRDNYYSRVKNGAWGGGPAPFGFDLIRTTIAGKKATMLKPNAHIETVKRIFELYSAPYTSLADVQKALIADGILTRTGVHFDNVKLSSVLKSPSYVRADLAIYNYYKSKGAIMGNAPEEYDGIHSCILVGKRNANDRKYKDVSGHLLALSSHEGVVDSSAFLFCQQKLAKNRQIKNTAKGKYSWLTGIIKCSHCGYAFTVRNSPCKEGIVSYFCCSGKYLHHVCNVKQTHRVADVEAAVEQQLIARSEARTLSAEPQDDTRLKKIQQQILDIDAKIENLILSIENSSAISAEYINQRIEALHSEKLSLQQQYNDELIGTAPVNVVPFSAEDWKSMSVQEKSKIARNFISEVQLGVDSIHVVFKV